MKLSNIEKIMVVATLVILVLLLGKSKNQPQKKEEVAPIAKTETEKPSKPEITEAEAELELQIFSKELDVNYDDMQEVTFYSCRNAGRSPLYFIKMGVGDPRIYSWEETLFTSFLLDF